MQGQVQRAPAIPEGVQQLSQRNNHEREQDPAHDSGTEMRARCQQDERSPQGDRGHGSYYQGQIGRSSRRSRRIS